MFAAERTRKIKEILLEYKHVDVNTLCSLLDCSIATVRRDLDKLEEEGFLTKAYGGALLNEDNISSVNIKDESDPYLEDKKAAAKIAATLIENDDIIYISPGTTCTELARCLDDKRRLTVITNNFNAAAVLENMPGFEILFLGGSIKNESAVNSFTYGVTTVSEISSLFIHKAFFTVSGISMEYGYTVGSMAQSELYKTVTKQAEASYIIANSSKFDQRSMIKFADILSIPYVITNADVSSRYKEYFFSNKIAIYTSFDEK